MPSSDGPLTSHTSSFSLCGGGPYRALRGDALLGSGPMVGADSIFLHTGRSASRRELLRAGILVFRFRSSRDTKRPLGPGPADNHWRGVDREPTRSCVLPRFRRTAVRIRATNQVRAPKKGEGGGRAQVRTGLVCRAAYSSPPNAVTICPIEGAPSALHESPVAAPWASATSFPPTSTVGDPYDR